jgi:hypothetical protein
MIPRTTAILVLLAALAMASCGTKSQVWIDPGEWPDSGLPSPEAAEGGPSTDSATETGTGDDPGCQLVARELLPEPVLVLVMLDRSISMATTYLGPINHADIAAAALLSLVGEHEGTELIYFGLGVFPPLSCENGSTDPDHVCDPSTADDNPLVNLEPETFADFALALDEMGACGGTPACHSLIWTHEHLVSLELTEIYPGLDKRVLLIMDGTPNCNPDYDSFDCLCEEEVCETSEECVDDLCTYEAALQLACAEIPVYVVGLGPEPLEWDFLMHGIAAYGETGEAWLTEGPEELEDSLGEVADEVVSCQLEVDWGQVPEYTAEPPYYPIAKSCDALNPIGVQIGLGQEVELCYMPDCSWEDPEEQLFGWHYEAHTADFDELGDHDLEQCAVIQLCPLACQTLIRDEQALFVGEFGCEPGCH